MLLSLDVAAELLQDPLETMGRGRWPRNTRGKAEPERRAPGSLLTPPTSESSTLKLPPLEVLNM